MVYRNKFAGNKFCPPNPIPKKFRFFINEPPAQGLPKSHKTFWEWALGGLRGKSLIFPWGGRAKLFGNETDGGMELCPPTRKIGGWIFASQKDGGMEI